MIAAAVAGLMASASRGTVKPPTPPAKPDLEIPVINTAGIATSQKRGSVNIPDSQYCVKVIKVEHRVTDLEGETSPRCTSINVKSIRV